MAGMFCLNSNYSTNRLLSTARPVIINNLDDTFETLLFLPEGEGRIAEGGLRARNYFKSSYADKPLITVITVVFNGAEHLEETILSVVNQTYDNIEYIIIDGGSSDGTLDIIRRHDEQIDYWVSEKDHGLYDAMNKGIRCSFGDAIGIINSDDWYELNAVAQVVSSLNDSCNCVVHANMNVYQGGDIHYKADFINGRAKMRKGMIINHPSAFVGKSLYKEYGCFDTKYKIAADWDLMLRFWEARVQFMHSPDTIANFRLGGVSYNINLETISEKHEIRRKNKAYNVLDFYYLIDMVRLLVFGKYVSKISIARRRFNSMFGSVRL